MSARQARKPSPREQLAKHFISGLRWRRRRRGMTQAELAKRLGVNQSGIARLERKQRGLELVEFIIVARALGEDPSKVFRTLYKSFRRGLRLGVTKNRV